MRDCLDLLRSVVEAHPTGVAVSDGNNTVTYRQFYDRTLQVAGYIRSRGIRPRVAVDLPQGLDAYTVEFATLAAGGAFCPLNALSPDEMKVHVVRQFNANIVVVGETGDGSKYGATNALSVPEIAEAGISPGFTPPAAAGDDLAYVIYTSGSTGRPKGVKIVRRALNKFLSWSVPTYGAAQGDQWAQFSLMSFDLSIVDIFTCLCSGGTLVTFANSAAKLRPSSLIASNKISIWHSVPSVVEFMIAADTSTPIDLSSIRVMSFCGEPLKKHYLDFLFSRNPRMQILNTYGPTEGTLFCTHQFLRSSDYASYCDTAASIGTPIPGWNLALDSTDDPELSEIVIYGDYIADGYVSSVDDTKFVRRTFAGIDCPAFITGDLVSQKNGNLFFRGRRDRQIKLNGYRIEPAEVDYWLAEELNWASATVLIGNALYCFVEVSGVVDEVQTRAILSQHLEPYKIPRAFIPVALLPRNANHKIDYSELAKYQV